MRRQLTALIDFSLRIGIVNPPSTMKIYIPVVVHDNGINI